MARKPAPPDKPLRTWRISVLRAKRVFLGHVEATDAESAIDKTREDCMRWIGFAAFASLILGGAAWGQSVDAVIREFGFVGRWATNRCERPATMENWHRTITVSAAEVSWTDSCGD